MAHLPATGAADEQACFLLPPALAIARRVAADARQLPPAHRPQHPPAGPVTFWARQLIATCPTHSMLAQQSPPRGLQPQHVVQLLAHVCSLQKRHDVDDAHPTERNATRVPLRTTENSDAGEKNGSLSSPAQQ